MSHKELWEYTVEELDKEIAITKKILDEVGYHKLAQERLKALQSQRVERQIEEVILKRSRYAQEVLQLGQEPMED